MHKIVQENMAKYFLPSSIEIQKPFLKMSEIFLEVWNITIITFIMFSNEGHRPLSLFILKMAKPSIPSLSLLTLC